MLGKWNPSELEPKWEKQWEDMGIHKFHEDEEHKPIYSIDTPPPYTSGDLHMGHVLSYTYFDFVARYKRMRGFNVYYPQGWDCQGFPTEVRVEKKFGRLPREEFRKKCVDWTGEFIDRMKKQMIRMGYSPDWRYEYRTMSDDYHKRVQHSLLKMFEDGLVYRAEHPVFWCPKCVSAIAKAELEELQRGTKLNFVKFKTDAVEEGFVPIATTRPELLHACVAVFVHPDDERYKKIVGKELTTPVFNKKVKVMTDPDVDMEFGTGIVMMCTFGDKQDAVWTYRHSLPVIKSLDKYGKLVNAGEFDGLKVKEAKEKIIEKMKELGLLIKQEPLQQSVKIHDRCNTPIELILSHQWFIKLKGFEESIKKAGRKMRWVPDFTIQYFLDWTDYIEWDWVISRDRVFGTPIPFWNCKECHKPVLPDYGKLPVNPAEDKPPVEKCPECGGELEGEKAVCDCWVDSSITPLIIGGWPDDESLLSKVYPSTLRPQGVEIIRTWAFYTTYRCLMLTGKPPFKELLLNGSVLAPDMKKMSKSLGNVIPPDKLIDDYSADAVRQWAALSGALAKDRPFNYKDIQFAKSFTNKFWNASRFVEKGLEGFDTKKYAEPSDVELRPVDKWIISRMNRVALNSTKAFEGFDFFAVITSLQDFFWHEFCDYYLEEVKHRLYQPENYGEESKTAAQFTLRYVLLNSLKILCPIAPHVTEELYQEMFKREHGPASICVSKWPEGEESLVSEEAEELGNVLKEILSQIRKHKAENKMSLKEELASVEVSHPSPEKLNQVEEEIKAVGRVKGVSFKKAEELAVTIR